MITELTKKQEKAMDKYAQKWIDIGLRTKHIDEKKAEAAVNFLYDLSELERPKHIVFLDSPWECQIACNLITSAKVYDKVRAKVYDKVSDKVYDKVSDKVYDKVRAKVYDKKLTFFWATRSNMWMSWYSRFDFYFNEVLIKEKKNHKDCIDFLKHSQEFHQVYTFDNIAFVSDFPKKINTNDNGDLHDFNKAALIYRDGFAIYQSNGITMKEDYILTPADQITKEMYLKEDNADQKAEIVKKVGRDRMLTLLDPKYKQKLTTKLGGEYDLIDIEFSTGQTFPFLSMKCPSTGKTHILGVVDEGKDDIELAYAHLHNEINFKDINMVWEG